MRAFFLYDPIKTRFAVRHKETPEQSSSPSPSPSPSPTYENAIFGSFDDKDEEVVSFTGLQTLLNGRAILEVLKTNRENVKKSVRVQHFITTTPGEELQLMNSIFIPIDAQTKLPEGIVWLDSNLACIRSVNEEAESILAFLTLQRRDSPPVAKKSILSAFVPPFVCASIGFAMYQISTL